MTEEDSNMARKATGDIQVENVDDSGFNPDGVETHVEKEIVSGINMQTVLAFLVCLIESSVHFISHPEKQKQKDEYVH